MDWNAARSVAPDTLVSARIQAHWAAQIPASVGWALVPEQPDYGHSTLRWQPEIRTLSTGFARLGGFRAGLDVRGFAVVVTDEADQEVGRFALDGRTLDEAFTWLIERANGRGARLEEKLGLSGLDIGAHPVGAGAAFEKPDPVALAALEHWFELGAALCADVRARDDRASLARCWPHHFDLATLIGIDADAHDEAARSIGVGLSPGDEGHRQPYIYLLPWPSPAAQALPPLTSGGGWSGGGAPYGILGAQTVLAAEDPGAAVEAYVVDGVRALKGVLAR